MPKQVFFLAILCLTISVKAQFSASPQVPLSDRISFGGDFGLSFGSITYINISPIVGYRLTDKFTGGVGVIYQYLKYNKQILGFDFQTTTYGGRVFGRYRFLENAFGIAEFQNLNREAYNLRNEYIGRINVPIFFVGGGYLQSVGGKSYLSISLLYDIIGDYYSPYNNPLIQVGFVVNP